MFAFVLLYLLRGLGFILRANYVDLVMLVSCSCFVHVNYVVRIWYQESEIIEISLKFMIIQVTIQKYIFLILLSRSCNCKTIGCKKVFWLKNCFWQRYTFVLIYVFILILEKERETLKVALLKNVANGNWQFAWIWLFLWLVAMSYIHAIYHASVHNISKIVFVFEEGLHVCPPLFISMNANALCNILFLGMAQHFSVSNKCPYTYIGFVVFQYRSGRAVLPSIIADLNCK